MSRLRMYLESKEGQCCERNNHLLKRNTRLCPEQILLQDDCLFFLQNVKQEFEKRFEKPDYFVKLNLNLLFSFRTEIETKSKRRDAKEKEKKKRNSFLPYVSQPPFSTSPSSFSSLGQKAIFANKTMFEGKEKVTKKTNNYKVVLASKSKLEFKSLSSSSSWSLSSAFCLRIETNPPLPLFDNRNTLFTLAQTEKQLQDWISQNIYTSQKQCPNQKCQEFHDSKLLLVHFHFGDRTLQLVTAVSLVVWGFDQTKLVASVVTAPTKESYSMTATIFKLLKCPWLIKLNLRKYPKVKFSSFYRISFILNLIKPQITVEELKRGTVVDLIQWGQQTPQNVPFCSPSCWEEKEISPKELYLERSLMLAGLNLVAFGCLGIASLKLNDLVRFSNLSYVVLLQQLEIFQRKIAKNKIVAKSQKCSIES